jgi:hypothetical protein
MEINMSLIWGVVLILFALICWLGQSISAIAPKAASKLGLSEPESDIDPTLYADIRGEAIWDTLVLWTLLVAGILLVLNNPSWVYFGLVGGGMYLYFSGRGILARLVMQRRGIRIGNPETLKVFYFFLALWGLIAVVTIFLAIRSY